MKKIFFALLAVALLSSFSSIEGLVKNTAIAVYSEMDFTVPFSFSPIMRYDTSTAILYTWNDGAWEILADGTSSASSVSTVTLTEGTEIESVVDYFGDAPPTLTKVLDGDYRLTFPVGCRPNSVTVTRLADGTFTGSGSVKIRITNSSGEEIRGIYAIRQQADGRNLGETLGVVQYETIPTAGTVMIEFLNASGASGGYIIVGKF